MLQRKLGSLWFIAALFVAVQSVFAQSQNIHPALTGLGSALTHKGLYKEAVVAFKKVLSIEYRQQTSALLAYTYAMMGQKSRARAILKGLNELSEQRYVSSYLKALVCAVWVRVMKVSCI